MRQEDILKEKVGKKLPYRVPEGYFTSFKSGLMDSLPEYPAKPEKQRLTAWQRMRPYVYLAAMFAGIWCMMNIFHRVASNQSPQQPAATTAAVVNQAPANVVYEPDSYDLYLDNSLGTDIEIQDEITDLYPSMDDFKRDFYAQL